MSFTQADADRIRSAIAKGLSHARLNGEEVTFRSLAEMKETLRMIEAELSGQTATAGQCRVSYATFGRGL